MNQGKFSRRLIRCAIFCEDVDAARAALHAIPEAIRDEPLTRYLMFKVALMSWDHELGRQCIEYLGRMPDKSQCQDIIYACIRDAQNAGDRLMTLETLKAAIQTFKMEGPSTTNLPSIFRCAIRLIHMIEASYDGHVDGIADLAEDTCYMFEMGEFYNKYMEDLLTRVAAEYAKLGPKDEEDVKIFTVSELHWFRKNAYNIGVTKCHV